MTQTVTTLQPDARGRVALGSMIDRLRSYVVCAAVDGSITLTPIAHVLTDEQYNDLQTNPQGFARLLARAHDITAGAAQPHITIDELFADTDD